jgi:hypothetical protein
MKKNIAFLYPLLLNQLRRPTLGKNFLTTARHKQLLKVAVNLSFKEISKVHPRLFIKSLKFLVDFKVPSLLLFNCSMHIL